MKIDIDLPWGGKLHYERQPVSKEVRAVRAMFAAAVLAMVFFLALIYMLR